MDLELTGKRALVTGGSRGIGKQIALQLALEGADVAIAARDQDRIDATVAEIAEASGRKVVGFSTNTRSDEEVRALVEKVVEALGGVDILVNSAAQPSSSGAAPKYDEITLSTLHDEIDTKVMGYLRCIQATAPHMITGGWGRIVNISGIAARRTGSAVGSIRNISVVALTKNVADELGKFGINANTVHPGATATERTTQERRDASGDNLVGRMIDASEVANVVTFLCSPKSVAISGDSITAGGGARGVIYY